MSSNKDWQNAYDDTEEITENTGKIPVWFSVLFSATIAIAFVYGFFYHLIYDWSQAKEYAQEVAYYKQEHPQIHVALKKDGTNPYRGDAAAITAGEKTFTTICGACHRQDGTGLIGPNIVDNKWLHGNTDAAVFSQIMDGITLEQVKQKPPKGPMPGHKNSLGAKKVLEVMAYLAEKNKSLKAK